MRAPIETSKVLDRGGSPTVRELLSSIVFNPSNGMISLNGDRIVMQRTAVSSLLRRELTRMLGTHETRIFLMRLGFLSGQSDARFVRASWPNLDARDAFTAGTRLHTFSGVVRVETVFNTYDFRKQKLTAEFLWHDSAEAAEFRSSNRPSPDPVCWTQLGYASGYASEFFDTLIVYKEVECAGQGHSNCRVLGKHADGWGASDPEVALFRERIIATPEPASSGPIRKAGVASGEQSLGGLDRVLLAPVRTQLDLLAPMALPVLVSGASGTGRSRAAGYLHNASAVHATEMRRIFGAQVDLELCMEIARPGKSAKRKAGGETILIDGVENIPAEIQPQLVRSIEDGILGGGPRIIALWDESRTGSPGLSTELRSALSALTIRVPTFAERAGQRAEIAIELLPMIAGRMGVESPALDNSATKWIEEFAWPGNLHQMRGVLTTVLAGHAGKNRITGKEIAAQLSRLADPPAIGGQESAALSPLLDNLMESQTFSLPDFEQSIYRVALERAGGNLSAAARLLGLTRAQLAYRVNGKHEKTA
ncbi:XylR N-terminal domain-containing protein [Rhizobium sp. TH2]|uniref:XylR N-terminal domain-containing protein n=1 Tax=Rhizobium sp. TH2 TaxID=2775403 RepID=UPI0021584AE0|nr:XylR N-terminal domain-containing protein [Rhizobium sp. TH2]UVC09414.1 XylR N-terminal domain-containing protein [Rhizobium sp. TH2]